MLDVQAVIDRTSSLNASGRFFGTRTVVAIGRKNPVAALPKGKKTNVLILSLLTSSKSGRVQGFISRFVAHSLNLTRVVHVVTM